MHSVSVLSALLAVCASLVSAAGPCDGDYAVTQTSQAIPCETVTGSLQLDSALSGSVDINGPEKIGGFNITNATSVVSITSRTITTVTGTMKLEGLQLFNSLDMPFLTAVANLRLTNLPQFSLLSFGKSGVTKSTSISIADTFLSDLSGLKIATAETIEISNNAKLTLFNSDLVNVTKSLKLTNNGNNMEVRMPSLLTAGDVQFRQVKSFLAPVLTQVESIKFNDSPELLSVSANNLSTISASLTFINNKKLANLSFASLTKIMGDMTIINNTDLLAIDGFPKLETVGNVLLAGSMQQVKLPGLKLANGSVTVTSTTDISSFCASFKEYKDNGVIRGKMSCTSNNKDANKGDKSGGESSGDKQDVAGIVSVNMAMLGLAVFAGIAQMF